MEDFLCKNIANTLGEFHFAIHSDRKLPVSLQEDEEDALSKDLGMHDDVSCAVRRRVAVNHAFRRHRAHEIWCFKVVFHVFVQFWGIYSATNRIQIHR